MHRWQRNGLVVAALVVGVVWPGCAARPGPPPGRIVFAASVGMIHGTGRSELRSALADGTEVRGLVEVERSSGSLYWGYDRIAVAGRDGRIAFTVAGGGVSVADVRADAVAPVDSYSGVSTSPQFGYLTDPAWSPDGDELAVSAVPPSGLGRCIVKLRAPEADSGGRPQDAQRLTSEGHADTWPTYTPDGRSVAFVRDGNVAVLDLASGAVKAVTRDGSQDFPYQCVEVSPDGRLLAVSRVRASAETYAAVVIDWSGTEVARLARRARRQLSWSPDGTAVAVPYAGEILLVRLDGSVIRKIRGRGRGEMLDLPCWVE